MRRLVSLFLILLFIAAGSMILLVQTGASNQRALSETDMFMPLPPDEDGSAYFYFTNRTRRATTLTARITQKNFPNGPTDPNWFVQFCFSNVCYLDQGESLIRLQPNQREEMHIMVLPMEGAKIGEKASIVMEVWPSSDPNMKETFTVYVTVVEKTILRMVIDSNQVRVAKDSGTQNVTLDAAPFIVSGRTMVPLRFIGEQLGAEIGWDNNERRVTYTLGDMRLFFWVDQRRARINLGPRYNREVALDVAPIIRQSRTFVPVRYVSEFLGAEIGWDNATRTVTVDFPKIVKSEIG